MLHAASTLSVFVDADPLTYWCREDDLRREVTHLHGGYAQSKWVAEQLLLNAREMGLNVGVSRLGLLGVNATTGAGPRHDWFTMALPGLATQASGESPQALEFDLTPVDYAARVLSWLVLNAQPGIFHIANPRSVTRAQISTLDMARHDVPSDAAKLADLRSHSRQPFHRSLDLFKATQVRFQMENTARLLEGSGIVFPAISPDYLHLCLRHAAIAGPSPDSPPTHQGSSFC